MTDYFRSLATVVGIAFGLATVVGIAFGLSLSTKIMKVRTTIGPCAGGRNVATSSSLCDPGVGTVDRMVCSSHEIASDFYQ